ncbi:DUF3616 domain-containing protein [Streptomyces sp. NBC_00237]|uniref:DUF3616 domain-containing protein n=1 Tax=Streptomyces sp. NBC_00237 TaxID=2975687 RepID=UPI0022598588|nr:DUF3616 domain-containing protein [Streptomyces sp. NBC_00237]MCX5201981.1 DUF3616 domain-containing protein [Streptomyces sp. NBC_00237]
MTPPPAAPVVSLAADHLSGAVGATADPTVRVLVSQAGARPADLSVVAVASSDSRIAGAGDVTVRGRGAEREVSVRARGRGLCELTLCVTGLGGRTATAVLHYAASGPVQHAADTRYFTGACDASAAVDVGGGHLVLADDESNTLRLYARGVSGGPVRGWDFGERLGARREIDIEGVARAGDTDSVYWLGSMSNSEEGKPRPDRSLLFRTRLRGAGAGVELVLDGSYRDLRTDLIAWDESRGGELGFAAGAAAGRKPQRIDAFNAEGFAFAPGSTSIAYIGFRAPLVPAKTGGAALLVPVMNVDELVGGGARAEFGEPVLLDLDGLGVRDLCRNSADQYLIVAGSWAADDSSDPYALYAWDGQPGHGAVRLMDLPTGDPGGWECVVDVPDLDVPGARVQVIADCGSVDWYGTGVEARDLPHAAWKKARAVTFTVTE